MFTPLPGRPRAGSARRRRYCAGQLRGSRPAWQASIRSTGAGHSTTTAAVMDATSATDSSGRRIRRSAPSAPSRTSGGAATCCCFQQGHTCAAPVNQHSRRACSPSWWQSESTRSVRLSGLNALARWRTMCMCWPPYVLCPLAAARWPLAQSSIAAGETRYALYVQAIRKSCRCRHA